MLLPPSWHHKPHNTNAQGAASLTLGCAFLPFQGVQDKSAQVIFLHYFYTVLAFGNRSGCVRDAFGIIAAVFYCFVRPGNLMYLPPDKDTQTSEKDNDKMLNNNQKLNLFDIIMVF